jgi:hypothetical protein
LRPRSPSAHRSSSNPRPQRRSAPCCSAGSSPRRICRRARGRCCRCRTRRPPNW